MRTHRGEALRHLEYEPRSVDDLANNLGTANTLAILELAEQQRIANLIALGFITTDTVCETPRTLKAERRNFADWFPEIAVSLGMDTDEEDQ